MVKAAVVALGCHHMCTELSANYTGPQHKFQSWPLISDADPVPGHSLAWVWPRSAGAQLEIDYRLGWVPLYRQHGQGHSPSGTESILHENKPGIISVWKVKRLRVGRYMGTFTSNFLPCYYDSGYPWDLAEIGGSGPSCNPLPSLTEQGGFAWNWKRAGLD